MDFLDSLPTMSISEMRKYLNDNQVQETAQSKQELMEQVSEVLLSQLMVDELVIQDTDESIVTKTNSDTSSDTIPDTIREETNLSPEPPIQDINPTPNQNNFTLERSLQDEEYQECVRIDSLKEMSQRIDSLKEMSQEPEFEELSPRSLRQQRLNYYKQ